MVVTALTRNQVVAQAARGFESLLLRQTRISTDLCGFYIFNKHDIYFSSRNGDKNLVTCHQGLIL